MNLRQEIHNYLSARYGQTLDDIVEALGMPEAEVKKFLDEMVGAGTLYLAKNNRYRCNLGRPLWVDDVFDALRYESGLAGFSWSILPEDDQLIIAPASFLAEEQEGTFFEPFFAELGAVLTLFDKPPFLSFSNDLKEITLSLDGEIGGQHAWITLHAQPADHDEPVGVMRKDGFYPFDDDDDDDDEDAFDDDFDD